MKIRHLVLAAAVVPGLAMGWAVPASAAAIHPRVSTSANHSAIYLGSTVTIHGTVSPNQHGHAIHLQRYYSGHWHDLGHKALSSKSAYSFTTKPTRTGTWTYRAYEYRTTSRTAAKSRTVHVSVKARPRPASCTPRTSGGNCYKPGEFCAAKDHGHRGVDSKGKAIKCENRNGWRWISV